MKTIKISNFAAITALLESSAPDTVIQYDGITYRVAPSESKRDGFFEILTPRHALTFGSNYSLAMGFELQTGSADAPSVATAKWMASNAETWMRSARYNESLRATSND